MKSKRLPILLLLALIVPWAAMAQVPIPYTEGFENMSTASDLTDAGWITYKTSDASFLSIATSNYQTGSKALNIDSWDAGSSSDYVVLGLPQTTVAIKNLQITFSFLSTTTYTSFTVGYLTDANDASTFVALSSAFPTSSSYQTKTVELNEAPDNAARIAIKNTGWYRCWVDDINVSLLPTCPKPTLSSTVATTTTTATVSWTPSNEDQQLFDLYWSTSSTAPTAATTPSAANQSGTSYEFSFASLIPSSTYYVWVRGNCGTATNPDVSGGWTTSSVSFQTPCGAIAEFPWSEDFESYSSGNFSNLCWVNEHISGSGTQIFKVYTTNVGTNSTHTLQLPDMYSGTMTKLRLPEMTLPNANFLFSIDVYRNTSGTSYPEEGIRVFASANGEIEGATELAFISRNCSVSDNGLIPAESTTGWYTYELPIGMSGTCYIILRGESKYGSATYMDNFKVELEKPTITEVVSSTPLSTTVNWTGNSAMTGYVYQYKLQDATEWGQEHAVGNSVLSADITTVADGQYDFRLKAQYGTNYSSWVTTQFTAPGYCMVPSDLVITNVTWSQAELSWTEEFGNGEWTLLYKPAGEEGYTNYGTVTTADMPVTLGSLIADTTYNVKIYPTCDEAKFITDQFTTKCEPITEPSWEENFESYDATTSNYNSGHSYDLTASCWKNEHISGAGTYLFQISSYSSTTGNTTKKLVLPDMSSGTMTKLVLPGFEIPSGTNYQFSLDVYRNSSTSNYGEGIRVFASTNGEIEGATELAFISRSYTTAYTIGGNVIIPAESAIGWYSYELPIGFDGVCYIILRGESLYGSSTYMDNFAIEPVPTCHRPMNLAYTPASLTNHSVTLTWTAPEGQTAWQIAYSTTEFNPNNAGFDLSTVSTQNVTGENPTYHFDKTLEADATYYMYVRSNCGTAEAPDYSKWSREGCRFHTKIVKPYPTSLVASEKLPTSLKLGWTIGGGDYETAWDIYYSTSSEDVPTDETEPTIAGVTDNPNLIEGLAANTYYYFYVRSVHSDAGASAWSSALYTNTPEACPKPSSLTVAEPTPNSLKLSWTAGAAWQTAWTIAYSTTTGFDPTDETACTYVDAPTNPFVVEGLDSEQTYYFRVKGACAEYEATSQWNTSQATGTTLVNCPIPTTANATNLTPHTATLNWTGYSEKYNVRYRTPEYENPSFSEDFEKGIPATWTCIANGTTPTVAPNGWTTTTYSGSTVAVSLSWMSGEGDFDADNWLITPLINLQDMLKFDVRDNVNSGSYEDYYEVRLSTTGNAIDDFTVVLSEMASPSASWTEFSYDLSSYAGQQGYIAIHHQTSGAYWIMIDNFRISTMISAGDWNYSANNPIEALTTDIEGLDDDTDYEWQVQATCALDEENDWSPLSAIFHTPSVCTVPVADSAINITYNSADLYWTGYQDEYNVRYRHYVKNTQPATVILTAGNIWGDGTGYQMLLDADATAYGTIIPTDGGLTASGDASAETYAEFEYKIPINADGAMTTQNIVLDSSIRIQIPAGKYDWCITNPTPDDRIWIASSNVGNVPGRYDDFEFMPGATYEFTIVTNGENDGVILTATYPWSEWTTIDESITTTNYELGGLDDETIYEWQVKGLGECTEGTDWSEGDYFETLPLPTQTIALAEGWNWVSFYVTNEDPEEMMLKLQKALGENGLTITNGDDYTTYEDGEWGAMGELEELNNEQMYMIEVSADCTVEMQGELADPEDYTIYIYEGWNWIGFPSAVAMSIEDAFADFEAEEGDMITNGDDFTTYEDGEWGAMGDLEEMTPGMGFMYLSNSEDVKELVFPVASRSRANAGVRSMSVKPHIGSLKINTAKPVFRLSKTAEVKQFKTKK